MPKPKKTHRELQGAEAKYEIGKIRFMPLKQDVTVKYGIILKRFLVWLVQFLKKKKRDKSKFSW